MPGRKGGNRYYSPKTLKVLFAFSGNLCAVPGCSNPIVAQATADSDAAVVGQICHVYAAKDRGPRGNPSLSEKERNAPENLILMCGAHHPLVDQQYETYPADLLLEWKRTHEAKHRPSSTESTSGLGLMRSAAFVSKACDDEIERGVIRLRQGRLYANFPAQAAALGLADRIGDGDLSAGTAQARGRGLAWCARVISLILPQQARKLLERAKVFTTDETTRIAEAALIASGDRATALSILTALTSAAARTAALRIVRNQDGAEALQRWVRQVNFSFDDLDAEGKFILILSELEIEQWRPALGHAQRVTDADYIECPALYSVAGMAHLLTAVPEDLRRQVRSGIPFDVRTLPLAADEALDVRREAARLFAKSSEAVQAFDAAGPGNVDADYALWLRLNDPSETAVAREDLRDSMRDPRLALRRIHFAFQFGIELDTERIEAEIDRHAALAGGPTADEASARFSLAMASRDANVIIAATDKYRSLFAAHLDGGAIAAAEIEALIQAGLLDRATQRLHEADQAGVLVNGRMRLDGHLAEAEGADPITLRRRQFEATGDLIDLASLIDLYESRGLWTELRPFAEQLFERTRSLPDGLRVARAYDEVGDARAFVDHLEVNRFLIEQSSALKTPFAWSLYRLGRLADAESVLQTIQPDQRNANDRGLAINIAIASGRWAEMAALTTAEWHCRADRSARELLLAGKLARAVGAPHSQELIVAATESAPDDPHILSAAYMHAVSSGWEGEESAAWLSRAAALSGENGPMKAVSLQELAAMKPEWDQTEEAIGRQLCEATTPQFGAARGLNRSLLELALTPAFANVHEPDVRRQGVIFSYSGARSRPTVTSLAKIALDVTAILCLGRLGILGQVVAAFETVVIAHGTLAWLFEEQGNATFQQTSRMHEARAIRELIAAGKIQVLEQPPPRNQKLADEVGYELADLFSAANARSHLSSAYVVATGPIYRVGSLMAEAADLGPLSELVCDCGSVVSKLRTQGVLSAGDERQAIDLLSMQEPAPGQKKTVSDQAELYIDSLSVSRLHKAGVLGLLTSAGLKVFVSGSVRNQINALFNFDSLSRDICKTIEDVRAVFAEGIRQGRVKLSLSDENDTQPTMRHPTYDLLKTSHLVDAIVIDDRFLNRHSLMDINGIQTPILTTQDLLADLADRSVMSADQHYGHRTLLRRSGYQLIDLACEELQWFLRQATIDGVFFETAELKAIRFSLLKARMARVLNLPYEAPWLHRSLNTIIRTLKEIWLDDGSFTLSDVMSWSGWLIGLVTDVKGWACCAPAESAVAFSFVAQAAQFLELVSAPIGISSERGDAYHAWIDENLLESLELESPEIFAWLIARIREILISFVDNGDDPADDDGPLSLSPRMKALAGIRFYPSRIRNAVLDDAEVRERLDLNRDANFKFGASGPSFQRSRLLSAIRTLKDASSYASVAALDGSTWKVQEAEKEPGIIAFSKERAVFKSGQFGVLVESRTRRKVALQAEVRRVGLPPEPAETWQRLLKDQALDDESFAQFREDLDNTPTAFFDAIVTALQSGPCSFEALCPRSLRYYERLVGVYGNQGTIDDYLEEVIIPQGQRILRWSPQKGLRLLLLLGARPSFSAGIGELSLNTKDLAATLNYIAAEGDLLSQVTAIEIAFGLAERSAAIRQPLARLVRSYVSREDGEQTERHELFSALVKFVLSATSRYRTLSANPPYWRRLAALAHAALLERCILRLGLDRKAFTEGIATFSTTAFQAQSWADLRLEPRGMPVLLEAHQLQTEFTYRILAAADKYPEAVKLCDLESSLGAESAFRASRRPLLEALPGPVEGGVEPSLEPPDDFRATALSNFAGEKLGVLSSSLPLMLVFKIPPDLPIAAAEALDQLSFRLPPIEDTPFFGRLVGWCVVAAVTRNEQLRDALSKLIRVHFACNPGEVTFAASLQMTLTSSAAAAAIGDWCKHIGSFFDWVAFHPDLPPDEAAGLISFLGQLAHVVPELWQTCGRAEAALQVLAKPSLSS